MNQLLKESFGYCSVPKGTLLYHSTKSIGHAKECMFFGLDFWLASVFHETIQVWALKHDIDLIFLCDSVDFRSWTKSSIPRLYSFVFPDQHDELSDLDIKHFDLNRRDRFIADLMRRFGINGWLAPMEENPELEVCLFGKEFIQRHLELVDVKGKDDDQYFRNSLRSINLYPPKEFYERSNLLLRRHYGDPFDSLSYRHKYERWKKELIQEDAHTNDDLLRNRERNFCLREKLGI